MVLTKIYIDFFDFFVSVLLVIIISSQYGLTVLLPAAIEGGAFEVGSCVWM